MQEIAQFHEELTEIISRYQSKISARQLINTVSSVLCKQLDIKRASIKWERNKNPVFFGYAKGSPVIDELEGSMGRDAVAGISDKVYKDPCSPQEIAEASCDGDIRHCKNACHKLRMNRTTISDAPEFHIGEYFDDQEIDLDSSMMHL